VGLRLDAVDSKQGISGSREIDGSLKSDKDPPAFTQGSIGSAAYPVAYQPLAPGSFVSIFGSRLADGNDQAKNAAPSGTARQHAGELSAVRLRRFTSSVEGQVNFLFRTGSMPMRPAGLHPAWADLFATRDRGRRSGPARDFSRGAERDRSRRAQRRNAIPGDSGRAGPDRVTRWLIYCAVSVLPTSMVAAGSQTPLDRLANTASPVTVTIGDKKRTGWIRRTHARFLGSLPGQRGGARRDYTGLRRSHDANRSGQTSRAAPIAVR